MTIVPYGKLPLSGAGKTRDRTTEEAGNAATASFARHSALLRRGRQVEGGSGRFRYPPSCQFMCFPK